MKYHLNFVLFDDDQKQNRVHMFPFFVVQIYLRRITKHTNLLVLLFVLSGF